MTIQMWLRVVVGLATTLARTLGCISSGLIDCGCSVSSHGPKPAFCLQWERFHFPNLRGSWIGEKWEAQSTVSEASEGWGKPSLLHIHSLVLPSHLLRLHILLGLSFMTDTLTDPHLVFFTSLAKSLYICALGFVIPSLHIWTICLYLSRPRVPASTGCAFLSYPQFEEQTLLFRTYRFTVCLAWFPK